MRTLLALSVLLAACAEPDTGPAGAAAQTSGESVRQMYAAVEELAARSEHAEPEVTLQHLLVAVAGGRVPGAVRSLAEAEALAAGFFARARAGEDFDLLVKNHSDDVHPGIYTLSRTESDPPRVYARGSMVRGLDFAVFRLRAGELGVAPWEGVGRDGASSSELGFHVVLRLK
jgi:hypothetical protein